MTVSSTTSDTATCFWINNIEGKHHFDNRELSLVLLEKIINEILNK